MAVHEVRRADRAARQQDQEVRVDRHDDQHPVVLAGVLHAVAVQRRQHQIEQQREHEVHKPVLGLVHAVAAAARHPRRRLVRGPAEQREAEDGDEDLAELDERDGGLGPVVGRRDEHAAVSDLDRDVGALEEAVEQRHPEYVREPEDLDDLLERGDGLAPVDVDGEDA